MSQQLIDAVQDQGVSIAVRTSHHLHMDGHTHRRTFDPNAAVVYHMDRVDLGIDHQCLH